MAYIIDEGDRILLVSCDCGNIMANVPDAYRITCRYCERQYHVADLAEWSSPRAMLLRYRKTPTEIAEALERMNPRQWADDYEETERC